MKKPVRVAVIINQFQGYEKLIPKAIEDLGFEAQWIDARLGNGFVVKLLTRLGILQSFRRITKPYVERLSQDILSYGADKVLIISPEMLRGRELEQLRALLKAATPEIRVILYLWDSSSNRKLDQKMIDAVDAAYSFDTIDCDTFRGLHHTPLFHFHEVDKLEPPERPATRYDYCFVGTGRVRRVKILAEVIRRLKADGRSFYIYLYAPSFLQYVMFKACAVWHRFDATISRKRVPYETYLDIMSNSACVIDVEQENQNGLTIRTIDAIFSGLPLATTNRHVFEHDFHSYVPVEVFDPKDPVLSIPATPDSRSWSALLKKYHVGTWATTVLSERRENYRSETKRTIYG
jgi:hypothetical protein